MDISLVVGGAGLAATLLVGVLTAWFSWWRADRRLRLNLEAARRAVVFDLGKSLGEAIVPSADEIQMVINSVIREFGVPPDLAMTPATVLEDLYRRVIASEFLDSDSRQRLTEKIIASKTEVRPPPRLVGLVATNFDSLLARALKGVEEEEKSAIKETLTKAVPEELDEAVDLIRIREARQRQRQYFVLISTLVSVISSLLITFIIAASIGDPELFGETTLILIVGGTFAVGVALMTSVWATFARRGVSTSGRPEPTNKIPRHTEK